MSRILQGKRMPVFGDGLQTRSFSHISSVAQAIALAAFTPAARNQIFNIGGDEIMTVRALAEVIAIEMGVKPELDFLPARNEVQHAHCRHELARQVFPSAYRQAMDVRAGLREMVDYVRRHAIPPSTECPSPIEVMDHLPPSWNQRLVSQTGNSQSGTI